MTAHSDRTADNGEAGYFGYRAVDPTQKTGMVRGVFDRVADRYDLMNDLMSGGVHRLWKDRFVAMTRPDPRDRLLDVAGGTGDIAFRWLRKAGGDARATLCDINANMLTVGRDRAIDRGAIGRVDLVCGNAENLPFRSRSADLYTIAFGLRNVTHIDAALAEAYRVLRPGGRFWCLEFSQVAEQPLRSLYDAYSFTVIPNLGALVARDRESYRYLVESIRQFPDQTALAERMDRIGFARIKVRNLAGGIAAIHSGLRL